MLIPYNTIIQYKANFYSAVSRKRIGGAWRQCLDRLCGSVCRVCLKVLRVLADLQFSEREFQTAGALTEKALADKASVTGHS